MLYTIEEASGSETEVSEGGSKESITWADINNNAVKMKKVGDDEEINESSSNAKAISSGISEKIYQDDRDKLIMWASELELDSMELKEGCSKQMAEFEGLRKDFVKMFDKMSDQLRPFNQAIAMMDRLCEVMGRLYEDLNYRSDAGTQMQSQLMDKVDNLSRKVDRLKTAASVVKRTQIRERSAKKRRVRSQSRRRMTMTQPIGKRILLSEEEASQIRENHR